MLRALAEAPGDRRRGPLLTRRPFAAAFVLLFALAGLWSLAVPLFGVADEPAHTVRAAAAARLQFTGPEVVGEARDVSILFRVPAVFRQAYDVPNCYKFRADVPADCAPAFTGARRPIRVPTGMGRYPPAWYVVVGLPSLVLPSATGVRVMRLVSAALCAALLAAAFSSVRDAGPGPARALALGLGLAVTPMALFLAGSVNPSGVEIAAGVALWASLLALAGEHRPDTTSRLALRAGLAGAALVLSRPLSPLWAVLIVAAAAAIAGRSRLAALARAPAVRRAAVALAVTSAVAVAWVLVRRPLTGFGGQPPPPGSSFAGIVMRSLGKTGNEVLQLIGVFGWLDAYAPLLTYYLWLAGVGVVVLTAFARGDRRQVAVLLGVLALTVALPVAIESSRARAIGFGWFGRYTLPFAVGVPLVGAVVAGEGLGTVLGRRVGLLTWALAGAHLAAFVWALRRFMIGTGHIAGPVRWSPPVPAALLVSAFAVVVGLYAWWLARPPAPAPGRADR